METISRIRNCELGVTAINRVASEFCALAKIFAIRSAINAISVSPSKPRNADAITDRKSVHAIPDLFDAPHNLMPQNQRQLRVGQFTIDNVKVGAADGAGIH